MASVSDSMMLSAYSPTYPLQLLGTFQVVCGVSKSVPEAMSSDWSASCVSFHVCHQAVRRGRHGSTKNQKNFYLAHSERRRTLKNNGFTDHFAG